MTLQKATNPIASPEAEEFNQCPAWGCKRKFQATTNGGKSNISSLWIHMQNAHKAAFVVFRRLKRQGYDKVSLIFQSSLFPSSNEFRNST